MYIIILSTIIFIIIAILFYLLTKNIRKAVGYTILASLIIQIIFGFIIYIDAMQIKDKFGTEEKIILLLHKETLISGFKVKNMENPEEIHFFNNEEIKGFKEKNYQELIGNSYKLIIIKSEIFQNLHQIEYSGKNFSREEMISILESENAINELINKLIPAELGIHREELINQLKTQLNIKDDSQLKGIILGSLFSESLQKDPLILIKGFQENKIIIYPETATFIFIKLIPSYLMDTIQKELQEIIQ